MVDWLKRIWKRPAITSVTVLGLFLTIPWLILGVVSTLSDVGFSTEIANYRWKILLVAGGAGVLAVTLYLYWFLYYQQKTSRFEIRVLKQQNQDLNAQNESVLRLMERYKAEAQEDIFNRLKQLALYSIHQQAWKAKGARVERFRVESRGAEAVGNGNALERVTVLISLGSGDEVMRGMKFLVQDPTDLKEYGTIVIRECHPNGSVCSIFEIQHAAFWSKVTEAVSSGNTSEVIAAPPNVIVPNNPFKELTSDNAKQLLEWLQKLSPIDL
jgi:hypothetical protein